MVSSVSVLEHVRRGKINDTTGHAARQEQKAAPFRARVDQSGAILSSEKSIKILVNSHYFFFGVKSDSLPA
jgi:hypothetical protein